MRRGAAVLMMLVAFGGTIGAGERPAVHPLVQKWGKLGDIEINFADAAKTKIQSLDFRIMGEKPVEDVKAALAEIAALAELQDIVLVGLAFTDEAVAELGKCKKLNNLNLYNTKVTDKAFAELSKVQTIARLSFTGSSLSDKAMKEIAKLPNLVHLELTDTPITDNGLMDLRRMKNLRRLLLTNTRTTERGIANLQSLIPRLRTDDAMMMR